MSFYHVAVTHKVHTCPANSEPHVWDTERVVLGVVDGGPCRQPITLHNGDTSIVIACGRTLPDHKRCPACRVYIIETAVETIRTTGHTGAQR